MAYIVEHEGPLALFKGIGPQIVKGLLVQGILMMTKERMELLFMLLFAYIRVYRAKQLQQLKSNLQPYAEKAADSIKQAVPATLK